MKILHVAPESPGYTSGGKIVVKQSMEMLDPEQNEVDYVGPAIESEDIRKRYHKSYELEPSTRKIELVRTLMHFAVNKRYVAWKKLNLDFSQYDFVYLDFTKLDYVMKDVKKKGVSVIVRAHNVEYDYARHDYESNRGLAKLLVSKLSKKQEAKRRADEKAAKKEAAARKALERAQKRMESFSEREREDESDGYDEESEGYDSENGITEDEE